MGPRKRYSFFLDDELKDGLNDVKKRDGIVESEQIRRAIRTWLEEKGVLKAFRKQKATRKRS